MSEWTAEFGGEEPQGVGSLMREVVDGRLMKRLSANQRASAAWYRANGDRERNHTTGVFLKRARIAGAPPILGVYVDSHAMATDFGVNKDIYLARLANVGFEVSGIEFVPSREGSRRARKDDADVRRSSGAQPLPELDDTERETVESLVSDLPESLRASASKAVSLSLRREKSERANKHR